MLETATPSAEAQMGDELALLTREYEVAGPNLGALREAIKKLNKRARRLGLPEISFSAGDDPVRVEEKKRIVGHEPDVDGVIRPVEVVVARVEYFPVTVTGADPHYAGWRLIAVLQLVTVEDGEPIQLVRNVPGFEVPEKYRTVQAKCEHCGFSRRRTETFVVQHDDGEYRQVGRQCLGDFLGHKGPHTLAAAAEFWAEIEGLCGGDDGGFGGAAATDTVIGFLAQVAAVIRVDGWLSRSAAREEGRLGAATADQALAILHPIAGYEPEPEYDVTPVDAQLAEQTLEWAQHNDGVSDYEWNLKVACNAPRGVLLPRTEGIVASAIAAWRRLQERDERAKERAKRPAVVSEHFGTVGKRAVYDLRVIGMTDIEGQWGATVLVRFLDRDGNQATWFSSNGARDNEYEHLRIGTTYKVKATVKKHDVYKDTKQTVLTRCAILGAIHTVEED